AKIRQFIRAGHVTHRRKQRVLDDGAKEYVRTEYFRTLRRQRAQGGGVVRGVTDRERVVLPANRAAGALDVDQRHAVVGRLDLRVAAARDELGAGRIGEAASFSRR